MTGVQTCALPICIYGNDYAVFSPIVYKGSIVQVNTIDPGVNYPVNSSTTLTVIGDGSGCTMTPVIHNGEIVDVVVDNPGSDYTSAIIDINSDTGSGAVITAKITESDFESDQSLVEQTTLKGAIHSIKVTNPGTGYSPTSTNVIITGDGVESASEIGRAHV